MASGYSFAYDSQLSVGEKIERYFNKKNIVLQPVLDESSFTSDESVVLVRVFFYLSISAA